MSASRSSRRASTPMPGRAVRGSITGRPIMALLDLLGRRWVQRIVWELRRDALSFRALRTACDNISPSVLNARLADLRTAGLVESTQGGYRLTAEGQSLLKLMLPLHEWAERWARRMDRNRGAAGA